MHSHPGIGFCRACGTAVEQRVPVDDNRLRAICPACGTVHYQNPLNVVGTLPVLGDRVLLCRRAIEPRRGFWTLPAGFMELGETLQEGALRETAEEAGARVTLGPLLSMLDVVRAGQVHLFWLATMLDDSLDPGPETSEARLVPLDAVPWDDIAFRTVARTLRHWLDHRHLAACPPLTGHV